VTVWKLTTTQTTNRRTDNPTQAEPDHTEDAMAKQMVKIGIVAGPVFVWTACWHYEAGKPGWNRHAKYA
jgi:hypothetical protein